MSIGIVRTDMSRFVLPQIKQTIIPSTKPSVGKVYGVVTTQNTPTKKQFEKVGGFNAIGVIFYKNYDSSKNESIKADDNFFDTCNIALPLYPQIQSVPAIEELVYIVDLPSVQTQQSRIPGAQYYLSSINIWNNIQQNSQPSSPNPNDNFLGIDFDDSKDIKPLLTFVGDYILQGRKGNALRFSKTSTSFRDVNEWSSVGNNSDPIITLVNGFASQGKKSQYFIERINKDKSSIYLTSTQKIPIQTDKKGVLNNTVPNTNISDYLNSQVIFNSDRILINSKKDEVMVFAKTNIHLSTKNIISLNANKRVHLNSNSVFLGSYEPFKDIPMQPVLLGLNTLTVLEKIQESLIILAGYLQRAVSTKEGASITTLVVAGNELSKNCQDICDLLSNITSKKVFTS